MFMHAMPLGRLAESHGWKPGDLARSLGVRFRRGEDCGDVLAQAIHKGDDPMWLEEFLKQTRSSGGHGNVRRPKRSSRPSRRGHRSSRGGHGDVIRKPGYVSWGPHTVHKLKWLTPKITATKDRGETTCGLRVPSPSKVGAIGYYDEYPETHPHFCRRCRASSGT